MDDMLALALLQQKMALAGLVTDIVEELKDILPPVIAKMTAGKLDSLTPAEMIVFKVIAEAVLVPKV